MEVAKYADTVVKKVIKKDSPSIDLHELRLTVVVFFYEHHVAVFHSVGKHAWS
jgi:hypothetical protein